MTGSSWVLRCRRLLPAWLCGLALAFLVLVAGPQGLSGASAAELVMFDQAGCSWCRRWDREVGIGYGASEEGRRAPLRRIDIADADRSGVRLARRVTSTPTFVLAENGEELGRITGYPGADFFWGEIGALLRQLPPPRIPPPEAERSARLVGR